MIRPSDFSSIVVLTGAGISAESGLKTFRDNDGLWEGHRVEEVATPEAFINNPSLVQQFYNTRRQQLQNEAAPNTAHKALAHFQQQYSGSFTLITQNVDNLHEQAGSQNTQHMHGELLKGRCLSTDEIFPWYEDMNEQSLCPCCKSRGNIRPHIVWFGEMPLYMKDIEEQILKCDLLIAIGTSGVVYPAAGFAQLAQAAEACTVELNLEASAVHSDFNHAYYGPATKVVTEFFRT
ncbi:MAG: NAD-dependent protein deacylase [Alteromonadaceae bacterium]|nr:MAG: NAD-dependent protein deacylase [Alteromonadaceae bacterium]